MATHTQYDAKKLMKKGIDQRVAVLCKMIDNFDSEDLKRTFLQMVEDCASMHAKRTAKKKICKARLKQKLSKDQLKILDVFFGYDPEWTK